MDLKKLALGILLVSALIPLRTVNAGAVPAYATEAGAGGKVLSNKTTTTTKTKANGTTVTKTKTKTKTENADGSVTTTRDKDKTVTK